MARDYLLNVPGFPNGILLPSSNLNPTDQQLLENRMNGNRNGWNRRVRQAMNTLPSGQGNNLQQQQQFIDRMGKPYTKP